MNHYPRHISDWRTATWNLTKVQRCIYSDLIDTYYDKERPLPAKGIAEEIGCRTDEEIAALAYVLERYFRLDGDSYRHDRCDEEIQAFYHKIEVAQKAGKASAGARARRKMGDSNGRSTPVDAKNSDSDAATPQEKKGVGAGLQDFQFPNGFPTAVDLALGKNTENGQRHGNEVPTQSQLPNTQYPLSSPSGEGGGRATSSQPAEQRTKPSRKCPKDFEVTADMMSWAAEKVPMLTHRDIEVETEKFRDTTFKTAITDWKGAWRNWLRKEQQFREQRGGGRPFPNSAAQAREAERQRVIEGLTGKKNGTSRQGAIDVETRVVRDGETDPAE